MEWDLAWASGDLVFSPSTDTSRCVPCLEPQFAHLIDGLILSKQEFPQMAGRAKCTEGPWEGEAFSPGW